MLKRIRRNARHLMKLAGRGLLRLRDFPAWLVRTARDPVGRDRMVAATVFSAIFAVGVVCTDYLITGGPDWNPGSFDPPRQEYAEFTAAPALPENFEPPPAPVQEEDVALFHNANVSADDLLGAPRMLQTASYELPVLVQTGARPAPAHPGSEAASIQQVKPSFIAS